MVSLEPIARPRLYKIAHSANLLWRLTTIGQRRMWPPSLLSRTGATINHATIVRRLVMTTGYVLADLATKVAYFSLTAVAFLFVWMLLTGIHP